MRVIREITRPDCKITLYAWNNRYLIKLEQGLLEQTFKINEYDLTDEAELEKIFDEIFLKEAFHRFDSMARSLHEAIQRV